MDQKKFFYKLKSPSAFIQEYANNKIRDENTESLHYFGWDSIPIEKAIWRQEPILKNINDYFPISHVGILIMEPFKCYKWHVDTERTVGLNLLLNGFNTSHTIFSENYRETADQCDTVHLKYEKNHFYAFNTKIYHTVFNLSEKRHLLSVEFLLNDRFSYNDFLKYCIDHDL